MKPNNMHLSLQLSQITESHYLRVMNFSLVFPESSLLAVKSRKPYPSNVSDEDWNFVEPYLALIDE